MSKEKSALAAQQYPETAPRDDHPLLAREVNHIRTWKEWLERWEEAETMEEMLGLLHTGFEAEVTEKRASYPRLVFYLSIADGWSDNNLLDPLLKENEKGNSYVTNREKRDAASKRRQVVARKAFDMLCLHFFKGYEDPHDSEWQVWHDIAETLIHDLQNFFRIEKSRYSDKIIVRNCPRHETLSHNAQHAVEFLKNLAIFVLDWKKLGYTQYCSEDERKELDARTDAMNAQVNAAKPWVVEVLSCLDKLDILRKRKWLLEIDKPCLAKLKEIALREIVWDHGLTFMKSRPVATMREAFYAGSKAAVLLNEYEIVYAEHTRLTAIRDAERKRQAAEREIEKLTGRKK